MFKLKNFNTFDIIGLIICKFCMNIYSTIIFTNTTDKLPVCISKQVDETLKSDKLFKLRDLNEGKNKEVKATSIYERYIKRLLTYISYFSIYYFLF